MLIVADDTDLTERQLTAGALACPGCEGELAPWGWARGRPLRALDRVRWVRPRRGCCRGCGATHVLLPGAMLLRRADAVEVIGAALLAHARGEGHRRIAARLGRHRDTVRGWLRRFAARAAITGTHALSCADRLDHRSIWLDLTGRGTASGARAALIALSHAVAAVERTFERRAVCRWQVVSALCSGLLLANTSRPYPRLP